MNCEKCQELLSDFLDGTLNMDDHLLLSAHLEECLDCYSVHHELDSIVSFCREHRGEYDAPPNGHALWLRIRNTIENERPRAGFQAAATNSFGHGWGMGWMSGLLNRHWDVSLPQMVAAIAAICIAVSFATAFGLRTMQSGTTPAPATATADSTAGSKMAASYPGGLDDRMRRQQQVIDYWNQRVEQRKALWNTQTREAFERNLQVIDQSVADYREELRRNPHDEVSEEMLNAALNEKTDLLREFSDL